MYKLIKRDLPRLPSHAAPWAAISDRPSDSTVFFENRYEGQAFIDFYNKRESAEVK